MPDHSVDIAIIGAGIAGIGIGAALVAKRSIMVLEAEESPGYHSTGRSAAIYLKHYGNPVIRQLTAMSEAFYLDPPPEVTEHPLLSPRGELMISDGRDDELFSETVASSVGLTEISPEDALEAVPILRPEKVRRAAAGNAPDIDVHALHQGWIRMLRRHGGQLQCSAPVTSIIRRDGWWIITTPNMSVGARIVVNAAGAWADQIAGLAAVSPLGLQPYRRSMAVLPAPNGYDVGRWPLFGPAKEKWYCKPEAGTLYVSPAEEDPADPHDVYPDDMVVAEGLDRFEQCVTISVTRIERSWAGLRTFSPDRSPVIGFDPAAEGFFWLAGQGGYGIQTAPAASALAAKIVLGEEPLTPSEQTLRDSLDPARFG